MSVLLNALKKAAIEKKQKEATSGPGTSVDPTICEETSITLSEDTTESEKIVEPEEIIELSVDLDDIKAELDSEQTPTISESSDLEETRIPEPIETSLIDDSDDIITLPNDEPPVSFQSGIEDQKKALFELIKNSKKHQKKVAILKGLSYLTILLLLILAVAVYSFLTLNQPIVQQLPTPLPEAVNTQAIDDSLDLITGDPFEEISGIINLQKELDSPNNMVTPISEAVVETIAKPAYKPNLNSNTNTNTTVATKQTDQEAKPENTVNNKIIITKGQDKKRAISVYINKAYQAYNNEDMVTAKNWYLKALEIDKTHRDALLGLAAIAVNQNDPNTAFNYYQKRLSIAPNDAYANAGMISLFTDKNTSSDVESSLKTLLDQHPKSSHLHFIQGTILANKNQWHKAQSAFFNAWSLEKDNANYAFNLAVSLERIKQSKTAMNYYQIAIDQHSNASQFSKEIALKRLQEIGGQP